GKVTVRTTDGRVLHARVDEPKGDPGNTLSRPEIEEKTLQLGVYAQAATEAEVRSLIESVWGLENLPRVQSLLPAKRCFACRCLTPFGSQTPAMDTLCRLVSDTP